jgi:hypothetical protein
MALGCGGAFLVLASLAGIAQARSAPRVGILRFVGKGETDVRIAVTQQVGARGFNLVGAKLLEDASGARGKPLAARQLQAVAADLDLAAVIDGRVELERGLGTAKIAIRDATDGRVVAVETWSVRKAGAPALARAVAKDFWRKLGPALEEATGHEVKKKPVLVARRSKKKARRHK